jgi:hypothetical protein
MAIEFAERIRRIPVYPAADGYALTGDVALMASNETPYAPLPEVVEAASKAIVGANRYPDPTNAVLRRALSDLHGVPSARIAIGTARATSCSRPARRCSSRAPSSSTPGRRSRSIRTWRPPAAPARSRCRWTPSTGTTWRPCVPRSPAPRAW